MLYINDRSNISQKKLMHDVTTASAPINIRNLFTKKRPVSILTTQNARSSTSENVLHKSFKA